MDDEAFKAIIHDSDAFKVLVEKQGTEAVLEKLQDMRMKMTTQLATWGNEREAWFKRVNGLLVVVRNRIDEVKESQSGELSFWKDAAFDMAHSISVSGDFPEPSRDWNLEELEDWMDEVGL